MIQPINQLAIGSIAKIPSLPNINNITVLHINYSGVRVKGSETLNDKTTPFEHIISGQTPVEKVGFNEEVAKEYSDKEELRQSELILSKFEKKIDLVQNNDILKEDKSEEAVEQTSESDNKIKQSTKNNMSDENITSETPVVETAQVQNQTFVAPSAEFSAKEFAEANKMPYPNALAYLKGNAKEAGKRSNGRGRPTILYSLS